MYKFVSWIRLRVRVKIGLNVFRVLGYLYIKYNYIHVSIKHINRNLCGIYYICIFIYLYIYMSIHKYTPYHNILG